VEKPDLSHYTTLRVCLSNQAQYCSSCSSSSERQLTAWRLGIHRLPGCHIESIWNRCFREATLHRSRETVSMPMAAQGWAQDGESFVGSGENAIFWSSSAMTEGAVSRDFLVLSNKKLLHAQVPLDARHYVRILNWNSNSVTVITPVIAVIKRMRFKFAIHYCFTRSKIRNGSQKVLTFIT